MHVMHRGIIVFSFLLAACAFQGCSFNAQGIPSNLDQKDAGSLDRVGFDWQTRDAPLTEFRPDSAGSDTLSIDKALYEGPLLDHGLKDQHNSDLPSDYQAPDLPSPDMSPASCTAKYGAIAGFKICAATPTSCTFYFKAGDSCAHVCQQKGGACQAAAAEKNNTCEVDYTTTCDFVHSDGLCTCSL